MSMLFVGPSEGWSLSGVDGAYINGRALSDAAYFAVVGVGHAHAAAVAKLSAVRALCAGAASHGSLLATDVLAILDGTVSS